MSARVFRKSPALRRSAAIAALLVPMGALAAVSAPAASAHNGHSHSPVTISLNALKGTDVEGTATLTPTDDGGLKVEIDASNMVPGMPHAQHIHGDTTGKEFFCPGADRDEDDNGFISVEEGLPDYGNIHISLTTKGDTSPKSGLAVDRMPVADKNGDLSYERTLSADQLPDGTLEQLDHLHIVQHGVDANDNDKYDADGLGESSFAKSLGISGIPEEATDAASCGMVTPHGAVDTGGTDQAALTALGSAGTIGGGALLLAAGTGALIAYRRVATASTKSTSTK